MEDETFMATVQGGKADYEMHSFRLAAVEAELASLKTRLEFQQKIEALERLLQTREAEIKDLEKRLLAAQLD